MTNTNLKGGFVASDIVGQPQIITIIAEGLDQFIQGND